MNGPWRKMDDAPLLPMTGHRGPIVLGVDKEGAVHKTFYVPEHAKGAGWLATGQGYLMQWEPVAWVPLPDLTQFELSPQLLSSEAARKLMQALSQHTHSGARAIERLLTVGVLQAVAAHGYGPQLRGWQLLARDVESVLEHAAPVRAERARRIADFLRAKVAYAARNTQGSPT